MPRLLERLLEGAVGLVALAVSALTLWVCYGMIFGSSSPGTSRLAAWGITYVLVVVSVALIIYGLRLMVPALRVEGGRVIGMQGLVAFAVLYAFMFVFGILQGTATALELALGLLILAGLAVIVRLRASGDQP